MIFKKHIAILLLVVSLFFFIASVSASDMDVNDTQIASAIDNNDILNMENDVGVFNEDKCTYKDFKEQIGHEGDITLSQDNYTYAEGDGDTIETTTSHVEGNGAVLGMAESNIQASSDMAIKNSKVGNFTDLAAKIGDAIVNHDGILNLTYDYAYDADIDGEKYILGIRIVGDSSLTINGNNHTISGSNLSGIFIIELEDTVATLNNITFANAYAGAILNSDSKLIINNCRFINNTDYYDGGYDEGGAISSTCGELEIADSVFINNTARDGGAIFIEGADIAVTNCVFINNSAVGDGIDSGTGGAIYAANTDNTLTVNNCVFTNNIASTSAASPEYTPHAGAIEASGSIIITNSNFTDNSADNGGAIRIYSDSVSVENCNFINNTASANGGAVYFDEDYTDKIIDCNFTDNSASNGGAIYFNGQVNNATVIGFFKGNNAERAGGAIFVRGKSLNNNFNAKFYDNKAKGASGGAILFRNLSENNHFEGIFHSNYALYGGGIFFYNKANDNVFKCEFTNNTAKSCGGAMFFHNTTNRNNFTGDFISNHALGEVDQTVGNGGAITFKDVSTNAVFTCDFINNTAALNGGGVNYRHTPYNITLNSNFINNTSPTGGGVNFFESFENVIFNGEFIGNSAENGGAIAIVDGSIKDVSFKNNHANNGGAVYFAGSGLCVNCNFVNNSASNYGGAVYFNSTGSVENCNFTGNNATTGSAIYFDGTETKTVCDSIFLNNRANAEALDIVKTENNITITFTGQNNLLNAIYSRNDAEVAFTNVKYWGANGITTVSAKLSESNKAAGQKITVGVVVNDKLVLSDVMVTDENGTIVLNINAGENYYIGARHYTDSYYTEAEKTISNNAKFNVNVTSQTTNNRTVNITAESNIPNDAVQGKLLFILPDGCEINATYGTNGTWWAEHTFDAYGEYKVNATYNGLDNVTLNNGTITIIRADSTITLDNVTLDYGNSTNLTVTTTGATGITAKIDGNDVAVINNYTIQISGLGAGTYTLTVTTIPDDDHNSVTKQVNITVNKLSTEITLANKTLNLKVGDEVTDLANLTPAGAGNLTLTSSDEDLVYIDDDGIVIGNGQGQAIITVSFAGNENYAAAENKTITVNVELNDASVSVENATLNLKVDETSAINATIEPDTIMLHIKYTSSDDSVATVDKNGIVTAVGEGRAIITLEVGDDEIYAKNSTTVTVTVSKINTTADVSIPENITVGDNSTVNVILPADATGNVTVKVDGEVVDTVSVTNGTASVELPALDAGNHTAEIAYSGDDKYKPVSKTATVSVGKDSTGIEVSDVTATYKVNKYLVITLKDSHGNPLANTTVTVKLSTAKNYTTDKNGQIKVKVSNLVPKTYTAKITFAGNDNYLGSNATAKVVVKKATPKITASNKMFKTTAKTKKYTITLKDNTGKPIRNAKVTLKVNGKTYNATTNTKGKATFKITKLTKKGTFKATVTYKGNKYYKKATKKANIKVISTWKTISKGSKEKSTVKKIQRALKNNGYYLTAYGHYLMVDGVYWDCTVKAVKQFQKSKGLKVTGKVDEKTAKKLGII